MASVLGALIAVGALGVLLGAWRLVSWQARRRGTSKDLRGRVSRRVLKGLKRHGENTGNLQGRGPA